MSPPPIRFFNTLSRAVETFTPLRVGAVGIYCCGPTVYHYAHIGNLRTYVFEDVLRRFLESEGFKVTHVMNITDVGHLESDADEGEDKMILAARREQKSPWDIARFFEDAFFADTAALNLRRPTIVCRATDHIAQMITFVKALEEKGMAYSVEGNVYFDTTKFLTYADFGRLDLAAMQEHARVDKDPRKRSPQDFVLWFSQSKYPNQIMKWDSPWGVGFPGWHIECSAMASHYLGARFDIHCGGIDHIPVHHTNEIAQSEGRFGDKWVNYWLHGEFLVLDKGKMSKSKGDTLTIETLREHGYNPMGFRYLCLTTHYRGPLKFSYESLESACNALETLRNKKADWESAPLPSLTEKDHAALDVYRGQFRDALAEDLNTPVALSVLWTCLRDEKISDAAKLVFLKESDVILGLLKQPESLSLTAEQENLITEREKARAAKDWSRADELRQSLEAQGIILKDRATGTDWFVKR